MIQSILRVGMVTLFFTLILPHGMGQETTILTIFCQTQSTAFAACEERIEALRERLAPYAVDLRETSNEDAAVSLTVHEDTLTFAGSQRSSGVSSLVMGYLEPDFYVLKATTENIEDFVTAMMLYDLGRCTDSLALLRQEEDHNLAITYTMAVCAIEAADYTSALEKLLEESPTTSITYATTLAWLHIQLGEPEQAQEVMAMIIQQSETEHSEEVIRLYQNSAQIHALTFDYTLAIENVDAALALAEEMGVEESKFAELYTLRGEIVLLTYEWDAALADFNTALEFDANHAPAYFERGILYYTRAEREAALADFQMYLALAPDGNNAELAQQYSESIEIELDALD